MMRGKVAGGLKQPGHPWPHTSSSPAGLGGNRTYLESPEGRGDAQGRRARHPCRQAGLRDAAEKPTGPTAALTPTPRHGGRHTGPPGVPMAAARDRAARARAGPRPRPCSLPTGHAGPLRRSRPRPQPVLAPDGPRRPSCAGAGRVRAPRGRARARPARGPRCGREARSGTLAWATPLRWSVVALVTRRCPAISSALGEAGGAGRGGAQQAAGRTPAFRRSPPKNRHTQCLCVLLHSPSAWKKCSCVRPTSLDCAPRCIALHTLPFLTNGGFLTTLQVCQHRFPEAGADSVSGSQLGNSQ